MKRVIIFITIITLSFLIGCENPDHKQEDITVEPIVSESLPVPEASQTPVYIQNSGEFTLKTIVMPEKFYRNTDFIKPDFFKWGDYVPLVKYSDKVLPSKDDNVQVYSYAVFDNNIASVNEGRKLYEKFNNKYLTTTSIPDKAQLGTLTVQDEEFNTWKDFFEKSRVVYISENADKVYRFSFDYTNYNENNLITKPCAGKTELVENGEASVFSYEEKLSLLNYTAGEYGAKDNPVFEKDTRYVNSKGFTGTQTLDNAIILYSNSGDNYQTASIYSTDLELIAHVDLPYKLPTITRKENYNETHFVFCEIAQVVGKTHLLLVFTEEDYFTIYNNNLMYSQNYAFLYDIENESYEYIESQVCDPMITPDLKYFIYAPRISSFNSNYPRLDVSVGSHFNVINLEDNTYTVLTTSKGLDLSSPSVVNWVSKEAFYKTLGEDTPDVASKIITLETESDKAENIVVEIPVSGMKNEFVFEEGTPPSEFDFGGYLPFFKKTSTYSYTGIIMEDYALFSNETHSLESAEGLYKRFNEAFINKPLPVDKNGNELQEFPFLEEKVCGISPDCQRIVVNQNVNSYEAALTPAIGFSTGLYYFHSPRPSLYINNKLARPSVEYSYENPSKMLYHPSETTAAKPFGNKAYKIGYKTFYAPDETFVQIENTFIYSSGNIRIYSSQTNELLKAIRFKKDADIDYDAVQVGEETIGAIEIGNVLNGKYVPITAERNIKHPEGDCTCGMRGHQNKILYLYNIETQELKLLANNFISYSLSPDGRYVAYTYNTVVDKVEELNGDKKYYEIFEGGIFIKNTENGDFVSFPYKVVNTSHDDTPTAAWQPIGWVEEDNFNQVLSDIENREKETHTIHLIPQPDENTVEFTLEEPEDLTLDREYLEPKGDFSFGDYLPFVRYYDQPYGSSCYFSSFSVLSDETKSVEDGNILYEKFNNKYKKVFESCEKVDEKTAKHLFESKVIYISENVDTVATFALQNKGKAFEKDDYTNRVWGSEYKVFKNGELSFSETCDSVNYDSYSLGKYYTSGAVREFSYDFDDRIIKTTENGYLLGDIYRDENVRIYRIEENEEQPYLLVYSLKEDRIIYKINLSEKLAKYPYQLIEQVIDDKYFIMTFETDNPHSSTECSKTFLYDIETGRFKYIASNIANPLISPDMKYIVASSRRQYNSFCVIELESGNVAEFKSTDDTQKGFYDKRMSLETVSWIRKDEFTKAIQ